MDVNPFSNADTTRHASLSTPSVPPPPYESIMEAGPASDSITTGNYPSSSTSWAAESSSMSRPREFDITVADPVKQGEGVSAYVSYKVRSHTTLPQYSRRDNEVIRRFRDFAWLSERLSEGHKGCIVPPLPDKSAVQKWQMAADFIEERRRALQVFINRVASHPVLKASKELQSFLEASEDEWALEMARVQVQSGGAKRTLDTAVGWIKGIGSATTALVQGKGNESTEDPEYMKIRDYIAHLEAHLSEAHRQATRLMRKEAQLADAVAEFGQSVERLGRLEEGNVQEAFLQLSNKAAVLAEAGKARVAALGASFEAPLKEAVRCARAVGLVCSDRAAALAAVSAAKHDLDAKKVRWAKLRGTPGSPPDKQAEAERDVSEAEARVRAATIGYDEVVSRMTEELNRYQKERAAEMDVLLRDFALIQAGLAADGVKAWSALLAELQAITSA